VELAAAVEDASSEWIAVEDDVGVVEAALVEETVVAVVVAATVVEEEVADEEASG
jgi:hypothetical protein